jgi:hypothetical protein
MLYLFFWQASSGPARGGRRHGVSQPSRARARGRGGDAEPGVGDAKGLETVLKGVKEKASSDDTMLAEAIRIFDHVYSAHAKRKA